MFDLRNKPPHPGGEAEQPAPKPDRFDDLCAAVFISADGKELLQLMRARTIEKRLTRNVSDADLRWFEAQRELVHSLEIARDRGLAARSKPA